MEGHLDRRHEGPLERDGDEMNVNDLVLPPNKRDSNRASTCQTQSFKKESESASHHEDYAHTRRRTKMDTFVVRIAANTRS